MAMFKWNVESTRNKLKAEPPQSEEQTWHSKINRFSLHFEFNVGGGVTARL